MKILSYILIAISICTLTSCEKIIDVDLNTSNPHYVIEADLNDVSNKQVIKVSQTVPFNSAQPYKPVDDAIVVVTDVFGNERIFKSNGNGSYIHDNFRPSQNGTYSLAVKIGEQEFNSSTVRVPYVEVDSIGLMQEEFFKEFYYVVTFQFQDPPNEANYYKYSFSVNNGPFKFANVYSDKFNNGLTLKHEITERDKDLKFVLGDSVSIRRECIAQDVYTFWNELQSINPGSAAPANPKSNISNGALGYFSVSSAKIYSVIIDEEDITVDNQSVLK